MKTIKSLLLLALMLFGVAGAAWALPRAPQKFTGPVAKTDLVEGDTLAPGFSITGLSVSNNLIINGNRYRQGGVLGNGDMVTNGSTVTGYGGDNPVAIIISETILYTPVDESGQDGNAWVVTYNSSSYLMISGIYIAPDPTVPALDETTGNWNFLMPGSNRALNVTYKALPGLAWVSGNDTLNNTTTTELYRGFDSAFFAGVQLQINSAFAAANGGVTHFDVPASWDGPNDYVTADDLPGFQPMTEAEARAWTGVPATGSGMLFYAYNADNSQWTSLVYENGSFYTIPNTDKWTRGDVNSFFNNETEFYYTTAGSATLRYGSSDPSVVTIDANGLAQAVGAGTATLYAVFDGDDDYQYDSAWFKVTITAPATLTLAANNDYMGTVEPLMGSDTAVWNNETWANLSTAEMQHSFTVGDITLSHTGMDNQGFCQSTSSGEPLGIFCNYGTITFTSAGAPFTRIQLLMTDEYSAYNPHIQPLDGWSFDGYYATWEGKAQSVSMTQCTTEVDQIVFTLGGGSDSIVASATEGQYLVIPGAEVSVIATAVDGAHVSAWSGIDKAVTNLLSDTATLTVGETMTLTATFAQNPLLTLEAQGNGTVEIAGLAGGAGGEVTIGNGTTTVSNNPYNSPWGYSFVESLYTAEEIGTSGIITSVSYNMQSTDPQGNDFVIYMKNVSRSTFASSTDYEPVTDADIVYSGSVTFNNGWTTITLDTPFEYDGTSNLMIAFDENTPGYNSRYFYYTYNASKVISYHDDVVNPDPYNLGSYAANKGVFSDRANIKLGIASSAAGVEQLTDNTYRALPGTEVNVIATPAEHYHLAGWSNNVTDNGDSTATLTLTQDETVSATFAQNAPELAWMYGQEAMPAEGVSAYDGFLVDTIMKIGMTCNNEFIAAVQHDNATVHYGSVNGVVTFANPLSLMSAQINGIGLDTIYAVHDGSVMAYDSVWFPVNIMAPDTLSLVYNEGGNLELAGSGVSTTTWNSETWAGWTSDVKTYTADGITVSTTGSVYEYTYEASAPYDLGIYVAGYDPSKTITFSSANGAPFTRIQLLMADEYSAYNPHIQPLDGWSFDGNYATWEGNAAEVTLTSCTTRVSQIVFYRGGATSADSIRAIADTLFAAVPGVNVTVLATPDNVHYLVNFDNDEALNSNFAMEKSYTVNGNTEATANFAAKPQLILAANPAEGGTVEAIVPQGEPVLLTTIIPSSNALITNSQTNDTVTVTLAGDLEWGNGGWIVQYGDGKQGSVSVTAAEGFDIAYYKFYSSYGDSYIDSVAPYAVYPYFGDYGLYIFSQPNGQGQYLGSGAVTRIEVYTTPAATGVEQLTDNTYRVDYGTDVTVKAMPAKHHHLEGWSCTPGTVIPGPDSTATLDSMIADQTVSATFAQNAPELAWMYGQEAMPAEGVSAYDGFLVDTIMKIGMTCNDEFITAMQQDNATVHYGSVNGVVTFANPLSLMSAQINGIGLDTIYAVHDGSVMAYDSVWFPVNIMAPDTLSLVHNDGGEMEVELGGNAVWGNGTDNIVLSNQYTADDITFTHNSGGISPYGHMLGSFSFTSENGNFSRIEMTLASNMDYTDWNNADGWTVDATSAVWEGNAYEVVIPQCTTTVNQIVFTRGGANSADSIRAIADTLFAVVPGVNVTVLATPDSVHYLVNFDNDADTNSNVAVEKTYTVTANTEATAHFAAKPTITLMATDGGTMEIVPAGGVTAMHLTTDQIPTWSGVAEPAWEADLQPFGFVAVDSAAAAAWTGAPASGEIHLLYAPAGEKFKVHVFRNGQWSESEAYTGDYLKGNIYLFSDLIYFTTGATSNVTATAEPNKYYVDYGTDVTVKANANQGYHMANWSNNAVVNSLTEATQTLTVTSDLDITATFAQNPLLTISGNEGGSVEMGFMVAIPDQIPDPEPTVVATPVISGELLFTDSVIVTISCTSEADIYYTHDGSTNPTCDCPAAPEYTHPIVLKETTTIKASAFTGNDWSAVTTRTFTKVTLPEGVTYVDDNTYRVLPGTEVTVVAAPDIDHYFVNWTGEADTNSNTAVEKTLTMGFNDTELIANFHAKPTLTLAQNESQWGSVTVESMGNGAGSQATTWNNQTWAGWEYEQKTHTVGDITVAVNPDWNFACEDDNNKLYVMIQQADNSNLTFTSAGAPFTRIEMACSTGPYMDNGNGWTVDNNNHTAVWEGNALEVVIPRCTTRVDQINFYRAASTVTQLTDSTYRVDYGTEVTVTANATDLHHVTGWQNEDAVAYSDSITYSDFFVTDPQPLFPATSTLTITVTADTTAEALFFINSYDVFAIAAIDDRAAAGTGLAMGTVEATYTTQEGEEASEAANDTINFTAQGGSASTLVATPVYGYLFQNWTVNEEVFTTDTITITAAAVAVANFVPDTFTVTLAVNDAAMGTLDLGATLPEGVVDNGDGNYGVPYLTTVVAQATPASRCFDFTEWSDSTEVNADGTDTLTIVEDYSLAATFVRHDFPGDTTASECDQFTWHDSTYTVTPETAPTFLYTTADECDSTVTLYLTIRHQNTGIDEQDHCDTYTWINNETYTESDSTVVYTLEGANAEGCDSVVTLHLTIRYSTEGSFTAQANVSYEWLDETFTADGVYTRVITNAAGCDSTVTMTLSIMPVNTPIPDIYSLMDVLLMINHNPGDLEDVEYVWYRWYRNGVLVKEGADADSYDEGGQILDGCYYLEVCTDLTQNYWVRSNELCFGTMGIDDAERVSFRVAPNPASRGQRVVVAVENAGDLQGARLTVYDAQGRKAIEQSLTGSFEANLSAGVYMLRLTTADGRTATQRLVVR